MNLCPRCLASFPSAVTTCPLDGARLVDADPLIGQDIASYHLEALLGAGGMARVYRARHRVLDRVYALKMQTQRSRPEHEARFVREAKIIAQLDHPNVVGVHDFGFTPEGRAYLVMEWIDGQSLADVIDVEGPLPVGRSAALARQILLALEAIHARGFVHRDLKPANVMLTKTAAAEHVTLLDFGLARAADPAGDAGQRLTEVGRVVGTPHYIAPEVMRMEGPPDARADLYALGVILYAMLARRRPFAGATAAELLVSQERDTPQSIPGSRGLDRLAITLLAPRPADRPGSARRVIEALDGLELGTSPPISAAIVEESPSEGPAMTVSYPGPIARETEPPALVTVTVARDAEPPPSLTVTVPLATVPLRARPELQARSNGPLLLLALVAVGLGAALWLGRRPAAAPAPPPPPPPPEVRTASGSAPRAISALPPPRESASPTAEPPLRPERHEARPAASPRPSRPALNAESPGPVIGGANPPAGAIASLNATAKSAAAILEQVGWTRAEASHLEALRDELQALDRALLAPDLIRAATAVERLKAAVERGADPSGLILKERLAQLSTQLTSHKDQLARPALRSLEDRYFELAQRPRERLPLAEYRARLRAQEDLGRDIERALAKVR